EVRVLRRIAAQDNLVVAPWLEAVHSHAVVLILPAEKGAIVRYSGVAERSGIVVIRPASIEHQLDRNGIADLRDAGEFVAMRGFRRRRGMPHVVIVEMREVAEIDDRGWIVREHVADVAGDPFARRA